MVFNIELIKYNRIMLRGLVRLSCKYSLDFVYLEVTSIVISF